jgi:protein gp37
MRGLPADDPFRPTFHAARLADPLKVRKPAVIGVSFLGDLFDPGISDEQIAEVWGVMAVAGAQDEGTKRSAQAATGCFYGPGDGHTQIGKPMPLYAGGSPVQLHYSNYGHGPHEFVVVTKQAQRMRRTLDDPRFRRKVACAAYRWAHDRRDAGYLAESIERRGLYPFPNVWLGVSVTCQADAEDRIPDLLACPAAHRWSSLEPMRGPVDLLSAVQMRLGRRAPLDSLGFFDGLGYGLDAVVLGGLHAPGASPLPLVWVRSVRDQCAAAGVPFAWKQDAGPRPERWPLLDGIRHRDVPWMRVEEKE